MKAQNYGGKCADHTFNYLETPVKIRKPKTRPVILKLKDKG
jgi:hypothetical protein